MNNFLSIKAWIPTKRIIVKAKERNPVPVKWVFKSKEEADGLIRLKLRYVVKGYMPFLGVDFTDSFSPVASETSTRILIVLNLYYEDDACITELCDVESAFINFNMEVRIYIKWPEGIVDLGIMREAFRENIESY